MRKKVGRGTSSCMLHHILEFNRGPESQYYSTCSDELSVKRKAEMHQLMTEPYAVLCRSAPLGHPLTIRDQSSNPYPIYKTKPPNH
jgi:hypothetical protein